MRPETEARISKGRNEIEELLDERQMSFEIDWFPICEACVFSLEEHRLRKI